jgi:hypothetical protein
MVYSGIGNSSLKDPTGGGGLWGGLFGGLWGRLSGGPWGERWGGRWGGRWGRCRRHQYL